MRKLKQGVEQQIVELYRRDIGMQEILKQGNIGNTTLYRILLRNKVKKRTPSPKIISKTCFQCDQLFNGKESMVRFRKFCSKSCADSFKTGKTLRDFFGEEKAKNVTETARKREKMIRTYEEGKIKQANTKPERILKEALINAGLKEGEDFIHQFTFGNYVYYFAFPKYRELLEVHGDWWHANPAKYPHDPKTKMQWIDGTLGASDFKEKSLHLIQIKNIERDKKKWVFALENGWKCGFVWESDVCNTHNLKGIINGVKRTLQKTQ